MTGERYKGLIETVDLSGLKNKSIFITGGTGFFGYWLLRLFSLLNSNGYSIRVTLLSRNPEQFLKKNEEYRGADWLSWVEGDVTSYRFPDQQFDLVMHGAANTTPLVFEKPALVFEEIILGTKRVLDHTVSCKADRLLLISSGAVYGDVSKETQFISEDHNTAPDTNKIENAYGEAKRASEMLSYSYAKEYGISVSAARCFAFSGFGIGPHLVLNIFLQQALKEKELLIKSSGLSRRSFLHGRDLAVWLLKLLADGENGEIYNVGSDKAYTIKQLAELVRDLVSPGKPVTVLGAQKPEQRMNYIPSVDKAKALGLDVWTSLEDSIKEMQTQLN